MTTIVLKTDDVDVPDFQVKHGDCFLTKNDDILMLVRCDGKTGLKLVNITSSDPNYIGNRLTDDVFHGTNYKELKQFIKKCSNSEIKAFIEKMTIQIENYDQS